MWSTSEDHLLLKSLYEKFNDGYFGFKLDTNRMHAIGFSSGGFMTSRMAFSYSLGTEFLRRQKDMFFVVFSKPFKWLVPISLGSWWRLL